jgi:hypothetical protein
VLVILCVLSMVILDWHGRVGCENKMNSGLVTLPAACCIITAYNNYPWYFSMWDLCGYLSGNLCYYAAYHLANSAGHRNLYSLSVCVAISLRQESCGRNCWRMLLVGLQIAPPSGFATLCLRHHQYCTRRSTFCSHLRLDTFIIKTELLTCNETEAIETRNIKRNWHLRHGPLIELYKYSNAMCLHRVRHLKCREMQWNEMTQWNIKFCWKYEFEYGLLVSALPSIHLQVTDPQLPSRSD